MRPLKKPTGIDDRPRLTLVPLPRCMIDSNQRGLAGEERKLDKHDRQAGEAHALGMAVKPGKSRRAEFEDQLVLTELNFHDALLV